MSSHFGHFWGHHDQMGNHSLTHRLVILVIFWVIMTTHYLSLTGHFGHFVGHHDQLISMKSELSTGHFGHIWGIMCSRFGNFFGHRVSYVILDL